MASTAQKSARILTALEDLVAQEAAALRARDYAGMNTIAERAQPLIDFLVGQGADFQSGELRARFAAVRDRRQASLDTLESEMAAAREHRREADLTQRRVARIAPVYGGTATRVSRQLQAVG